MTSPIHALHAPASLPRHAVRDVPPTRRARLAGLALRLWRAACRHAERPDRVVPYL